jgi:DNA-binding HxlR family transcriptional regulator
MSVLKNNELGRRSYGDACGAAHALDLVGERWSLLVMRELMYGARRFSDLRASLPGISANVLTQRLESLEASGVLLHRRLPPPASVAVYELTDWGRESEPIFMALGRWAARSPAHDPTLPISATSVLMSFRTMIDPARATGFRGTVGFRFGHEGYLATIHGPAIAVDRGDPDRADVTFAGSPAALAAAVYGGVSLDELSDAGTLAISGNEALARRFLTLFVLPEKAG